MADSRTPPINPSALLLRFILLLILLVAGIVATAASGADPASAAKRADTRVSIQSWPEGVFGTVRSSSRACADGRRVVVFLRRGNNRGSGRDVRIGAVEAKRVRGIYRWLLNTRRTGRLYAKATREGRCGRAVSRTLRSMPGGRAEVDAPPCSPWVSHGDSEICQLTEIQASINRVCRFGGGSGNCYGEAVRGSFPWGVQTTGGAPSVGIIFDHNQHTFKYYAYSTFGTATLTGTLASSSSPNLVITDALAVNELGGDNGDRFYTPVLPGQRAGEVGGPLYLNWDAHPNDSGDVYIRGYLYLRP